MKFVVIMSLSLAGLATALVAYTSACNSSYEEDCSAAGGHCVLGDVVCAVHGSQACGSGGPNPGGGYCCLADTADCGQPSAITYACPPLEGGAPSEVSIILSHRCQGRSPAFTSIYDFEAEEAGSSDASYPLNCRATLPVCSNGQPVSCMCSGEGEAGAWACVY
jgi:hypothetical protein